MDWMRQPAIPQPSITPSSAPAKQGLMTLATLIDLNKISDVWYLTSKCLPNTVEAGRKLELICSRGTVYQTLPNLSVRIRSSLSCQHVKHFYKTAASGRECCGLLVTFICMVQQEGILELN